MDTPGEEQPKSAGSVSQPQSKVVYHGQPLFGTEITQDVEKMGQELRRREEMITQLVGEVQLYIGKIKGYQTLGHLYQESKQECNQYRLKYEELAAKLDTVMKRLLPEKDVISETGIDIGDRDASITFMTAADIPYKLGTAEPQTLVELPTDHKFEKVQRPSTIKKPSDDKDLPRAPTSIEHELQQHRAVEDSTENLEKGLNVDTKGHDGKSPSNSSASSPSFVCIGGSGLSSMDQTPTSDSLPQERTYSIGNRPSATVESLNDSRTLVELLSDPNSSAEMRAMASDLQRVGNRAAKIEKQARVQQVLLNELQIEKASLEQQLQTKQQELSDFREKYSVLEKKFYQLELEKNPSAIVNSSSIQSGEWIKVKGENDMGASCLLESPTFISTTEMNLRSQIQRLQTQIAELEITNRNLSEGCEHSDRTRHQLFNRLMEIQEQMKDQQRDDLQRQKECDEMIFSLKKQREELEFQKEQATNEQLYERQQRIAAEQQCSVLQDKISQLENRIHQLERQTQMNLMEGVRPPPSDFSVKKTEPSTPTSPNKKLLNELAILQQQVTIYKEDFDQERRDRESSQSQLAEVKQQLNQAKMDVETSHQQIKILSGDLHGAKKEIIRLKEKSTQALDELKVMKGQIRPVSQLSSSHHFPRQLSYGQFWTCQRCTFENPSVRATCEICGVEGSTTRFHFLQESEVDLLTGRGSASDISLREQLPSSLQDARSPRPSK